MGTVNGKLIHRGSDQIEEILKITADLNQRCSDLETLCTQKNSQEIDRDRTHLQEVKQKLEQRIGFLEELTSKQAKQISFMKVSGVIGLFGLWLIFHTNNQPNIQKIQNTKHSENMELIKPMLESGLVLNI